ncbi:hypothetical protein TAMA11512_18330 [Selenomonas sp. TAMA-11512]|uniref:aminoglycoside phosphotransferase n=1 Tax=Selenomonas sp. TAMA-11512 TaxID=3095337 RepID=UPI0030853081|nr:hypothetical protein TAMA11512_18330 [Selenomonas sp. TAMA-11512]
MKSSRESLRKLKAQRDLLQRRMQEEASDLDFETHLERVRTLQRVIDRLESGEKQAAPMGSTV